MEMKIIIIIIKETESIELYTHHMSLLSTSFHQVFLNSALVNNFCCKK